MSNKLFVGNLSFDTTENDLQDAFAVHGNVMETNLMMDRSTGRPRGFGSAVGAQARPVEDLAGAGTRVTAARLDRHDPVDQDPLDSPRVPVGLVEVGGLAHGQVLSQQARHGRQHPFAQSA